jgi:hypothetical protein
MTRRHKHPSANQLASLAVGELRPRRAAKVRAHAAQCEQCTRVCEQLKAVRANLASAPYPPMPADVSARIDSAISREARQRLAATPATEAGRRDIPARRRRAEAGARWRQPALSTAATRLGAAAAAVVIAAGGSYLVTASLGTAATHPRPSPQAAAVARAQQMALGPDVTYGQPGLLDTIRAVESRADFVATNLRAELIAAVNAAEALEAFAARPSANTTRRPSASAAGLDGGSPSARRLAGCVGLIAPHRTVLMIDIARYEGKPAAVIVTAPTVISGAQAWVVGSSCSATTKDVLTQAALENS